MRCGVPWTPAVHRARSGRSTCGPVVSLVVMVVELASYVTPNAPRGLLSADGVAV
jgi:hypothetical protein